MAAGATSAQDTLVAAPASEGTYWLGACVSTVSGESDTTNQCSAGVQVAVVAEKPDLTVIAPSVSDSSLTPGQNFTINVTVKNQGNATAFSSNLRYYRSSNATISVSDTQLTTDFIASLDAGVSSAQNASISAPGTAGTYWVGACADMVPDESNINNQCSSGVQITVGQKESFPWLLFYPAFF
ncbi:MAG: hypothetical protein D3906_07590 [Candidatus Electrothrix sp. AUS1_2]|nr:hypothetical protein [Candidatus Electrothrix sp. AUS1_2]